MNGWTLWQYRNIVILFLDQCDAEMQEVLLRRLASLLEKGIECKMPISEPLGGGLFALRGSSKKRQARLIYCFGENRQIIFVHAFYKTTQKIDRQDIETAKRNRHFIEEGKERPYGFDLAT